MATQLDDVVYGSLFKQPFFQKSKLQLNHGWTKRFFIFNKRNMLLQYFSSDVERVYKIEGHVRARPRSTIPLLTSALQVAPGEIERTMFGQKYTIVISNGPLFNGRKLVLAAASISTRDMWIQILGSAVDMLKKRQEVALIKKEIILDTDSPEYASLDNQHKILIQKESQLKDLEEKIKRTELQCILMRDKDKLLHAHQERLRKVHRQEEDKLYALDCAQTVPVRKFQHILTSTADVDDMYPYDWNEEDGIGTDRVERMRAIHKDPHHPFHDQYDHTRNVIGDLTGKEFDASKKQETETTKKEPQTTLFRQEKDEPEITDEYNVRYKLTKTKKPADLLTHEVQKLCDTEDLDLKSFRDIDVFELIGRENKRLYIDIQMLKDQCDDPDRVPATDNTSDAGSVPTA